VRRAVRSATLAGVVKSANTMVLGAIARESLRVRVPPPAPMPRWRMRSNGFIAVTDEFDPRGQRVADYRAGQEWKVPGSDTARTATVDKFHKLAAVSFGLWKKPFRQAAAARRARGSAAGGPPQEGRAATYASRSADVNFILRPSFTAVIFP
jgi:hypothetical protein